jgi:5'-nucleotidase
LYSAPDGRDYYWFDSSDFSFQAGDKPANNDLDAVDDRYVAITPLHFDLTDYDLLHKLESIDWGAVDHC